MIFTATPPPPPTSSYDAVLTTTLEQPLKMGGFVIDVFFIFLFLPPRSRYGRTLVINLTTSALSKHEEAHVGP